MDFIHRENDGVRSLMKMFIQNDKTREFEVRFGRYTDKGFSPNVSLETFLRIQKQMEMNVTNGKGVKKGVSEKTFVSVHENNEQKIEILNETYDTVDTEYRKKKALSSGTIDVTEYNYRVAVSSETSLSSEPKGEPIHYRLKERNSYIIDDFRLDMTRVYYGKEETARNREGIPVYEIELEWMSGRSSFNSDTNIVTFRDHTEKEFSAPIDKYTEFVYNNLINFKLFGGLFLLYHIQNSDILIRSSEVKEVLLQYSRTLFSNETTKFRPEGKRPFTLNNTNALSLKTDEYAVSEKADGKRGYLLIYNKRVYIIVSSHEVYRTNIVTKLKDVSTPKGKFSVQTIILEGEFIHHSVSKDKRLNRFMAYDFVTLESFDYRQRYSIISEIIKEFTLETFNGRGYSAVPKKVYFENIFKKAQEIVSKDYERSLPYGIDGVIFTPIRSSFVDETPYIYKWKSSQDSTIDFHVKIVDKNENYDILHLYVIGKEGNLILFEPNGEQVYTSQARSGTIHADRIVEFAWDFSLLVFVPLRMREDKNKPNFVDSALGVWENIKNPIDIQRLSSFETLGKNVETPEERQRSLVFHMRKFHNEIKRLIIRKYAVSSNENYAHSILELASGKGGDMQKYSEDSTLYGFDISPESVMISQQRLSELQRKSKKHRFFSYHVLDIARSNVFDYLFTKTKKRIDVDVVSCQFAMHYFFSDQYSFNNFFQNVSQMLRNGGLFIGTVFDGKRVYDALRGRSSLVGKENGSDVFSIQKNYEDLSSFDEIPFFGSSITVRLTDSVLSDATKEYLVNFEKLPSKLKKFGLTLETVIPFQKLRGNIKKHIPMSGAEEQFSFLNSVFIMKKNGPSFAKNPQALTLTMKELDERVAQNNLEDGIDALTLREIESSQEKRTREITDKIKQLSIESGKEPEPIVKPKSSLVSKSSMTPTKKTVRFEDEKDEKKSKSPSKKNLADMKPAMETKKKQEREKPKKILKKHHEKWEKDLSRRKPFGKESPRISREELVLFAFEIGISEDITRRLNMGNIGIAITKKLQEKGSE